MIRRSRWKCIVAFGSPVVPEVNPSKATSSRPVLTASNRTGLFSATRSSSASWFEVPSKFHDLLEKSAGLRARDQFVGDATVSQREADLCLVNDLGQFTGTKHRHGIDDDGACFRCGKPCSDEGRIVARAYQNPIAGLYAVILHQRMCEAVRPIRQLLVGALATVYR